MDKLYFTIEPQKSTQALNFFAIQQGGQINKMKALKLVFLADRYHLRKYGRMITNDNYLAMKHGPVPSTAKDIAEANDYLDDTIRDYSSEYISPENWDFKSKKEIDPTVFSESDLEALSFAWNSFGCYDQFQLRDITHSYPEWIKHRNKVQNSSCVPIDVLDFLKDPEGQVDESLGLDEEVHSTFALDDEDRQIRLEGLKERSYIESLWR